MAEHVFPEDTDGGGVGADVDECAAGALLSFGEHGIGQSQRSKIHLGHLDVGQFEAAVQVLEEGLAHEDVEEVALQACGTNAHGIHLHVRVHTVFLLGDVEDLLVRIVEVPIGIHQFDNHLLCDDGVGRKVAPDGVAHRAQGLSANADKDLNDACLQLRLQLLDDVLQALSRLVDVENDTLADEGGRVFPDHGQHGYAAVGLLLSGNTGYLRRTEFNCHNEIFLFCHHSYFRFFDLRNIFLFTNFTFLLFYLFLLSFLAYYLIVELHADARVFIPTSLAEAILVELAQPLQLLGDACGAA